MDGRNILKVLLCVLALSCVIVGVCLSLVRRRILYLPDSAAEDLISLLEEDNIHVDKSLVSTKKQTGNVYMCASADYNYTVASLLDGHEVDCSFVTPEGEIILMDGGGRVEFGDGFYFRYYRDGDEAGEEPSSADVTQISNHLSEEAETEVRSTAVRFLERGSEDFVQAENISVITTVERIWESGGRIFALCRREIDGVEIADNIAICIIDGNEVEEAYGSWCFLTLADSYSAQLHDMINILFNVKKELSAAASSSAEGVTIEAVERCYSLYIYGEDEDFCLIPCWKVVTDSAGEYIYNALDSTLYTKNK